MKILFVGNTSWSMWNFRREVMLGFKSKGHEVVVVAPHDEGSEILGQHFQFESLHTLSRKGKDPFRDLSLILELYKIYKRHNPDRIFQYTIKPNLYGSIAAFLCRKKPFSMVAGMGYVFTNVSILTVVVSVMYRIATTLSEKVLFLNQEDINDFRRLHMIPKNCSKAVLLPGEGVDLEYFSPGIDNLFMDKEAGVFVFIGRLLLDKGIRDFLQTARIIKSRYPNTEFRVVGPIDNGNPMAISESELQSYVSDGAIEYAGSVSDVRPYLRNADALVLPTYYGEGLSRVCLEALAMGKPVISTDNRGCKSLVIDGVTGLTFPQKDMGKLTDVITRFLLFSKEERVKLGLNGRYLVQNQYCVKSVIRSYEHLALEDLDGKKCLSSVELQRLPGG